jgi:beta-xylosidase
VSSIDPSALFPFGFGLSYTQFEWTDVHVDGRPCGPDGCVAGAPVEFTTSGSVSVSVAVRNVGERAGAEVVQLYLHDPIAQVTRPVVRLIGYGKVLLAPGQSARITFEVPADLAAFTGRDGHRIVEPGDLEFRLSTSSADVKHAVHARLVGPELTVDHHRRLTTGVVVSAE